MKLGDVLKKERELKGIPLEVVAARLGISEQQYRSLEGGTSAAEIWGPLLAQLSIKIGTQASHLISITGRPADVRKGACGQLIKQRREKKQQSLEDVARSIGISRETYEQIESGASPIEEFGPLLLHFAALIEQPVFNLFYPCALPLEKIESYP